MSSTNRKITGQCYWGKDIPLPDELFAYDFCSNNKTFPLREQLGRVSHWMCGVLRLYEMIEVLMTSSNSTEISAEKKEQQKTALMSISDQMEKHVLTAKFVAPHDDEFYCTIYPRRERLEQVLGMMDEKFQELVAKTDGPQLLKEYREKHGYGRGEPLFRLEIPKTTDPKVADAVIKAMNDALYSLPPAGGDNNK